MGGGSPPCGKSALPGKHCGPPGRRSKIVEHGDPAREVFTFSFDLRGCGLVPILMSTAKCVSPLMAR
jgi:hypothetical protein